MSTMRDVLEMKGYEVYSTTVGATIDDAVVEMCRVKVGALLVRQDSGRPAGIISERDLLIRVLLAHRDPATTTVGAVMTRRLVCVDERAHCSRGHGRRGLCRGHHDVLCAAATGQDEHNCEQAEPFHGHDCN